ncbi:MAG: hypothetical protein GY881_09730, partial [Gammaproteobacteria bacterium]|nr:hypothetical protein [Gammaproteobacteria bacterium]
ASIKGYIATGKGYTDISLFGFDDTLTDVDLLPALPAEAIDKLANKVVAVVDNDLSDLEQAIEERPSEFSNDEIAAYLEALGDDYAEGDKWLKVGMAVYHETKGSEDGYMLFDAFSRRCPDSYDRDMNRRRWESWGGGTAGNRITFASVIHWAGGPSALDHVKYEDLKAKLDNSESIVEIEKAIKAISAEPLSKIKIDILAKVAQDRYKKVTGTKPGLGIIKSSFKTPSVKREVVNSGGDFIDEYVFITSTDKYFHKETKAQMSQKAFDTKHNRMTPQDEENRITASRYAERAIHCVESDMYAPAFGELFTHENLEYINSYRKSLLVATPAGETDIIERVKAHVAHLLVSKEQQEILISYLAHCVQYPGRKIHWGIVLQGVQGDGKSFFAEMMQHVMGKNNVRTLDVQVLNSEFTGWAVGQCITFIEELKLDNYKKYEVL